MTKKICFLAGLLAGGPLALLIANAAITSERAALREIRDALAELRDRQPSEPTCAGGADRNTVTAADAPMLRGAITAMVRETLRTELARTAAPAVKEAPPPTPENLEAFQAGERLIQRALQGRTWTQLHREDFQRLLAQMTEEQRERALQTLLPAINRGDLQPDGAGPPL